MMVKRVSKKGLKKAKKNRNTLAAVAALIVSILLAYIIYLIFTNFLNSNSELGDFEGNRYEEYCRQVHKFIETDGKEGWSDYRNIYYKDCLGAKPKKGWR